MKLENYRKNNGMSYEKLARALNVTTNTAFKICKTNYCLKMAMAHRIIKVTGGAVGFEDFSIEGDC